ncbi:potassium-transporting ATPase subunit F [Aureibacillus halotolerans]
MIDVILMISAVVAFGYLAYALLHPERF